MREILFRAFVKDKNKIFNVKEIDFTNSYIHFEEENKPTDTLRMFDQIELMQYTGLTDKNGKQIFEGAILRLCDATYPCEIYWSGIGWAIKRNGKQVDYNYGSSLVVDCEKMQVIGNIYDNPELLGSVE